MPPGTIIDNTAQAGFRTWGADQSVASNTVSLTTTWMRTPSQIELLQYAPSVGGAEPVQVPLTDYSEDGTTGGTTQSIAAIYPAGSGTSIDLSAPIPLAPVSIYHQGEPIFFRVTDADQNIDPLTAETIWILATTPSLGDSELLLLTETGPDSGVFVGYLQSFGLGPVQAYNGLLDVTQGAQISAQYTDAADASDSVAVAVLVDPYGLVFDSATGQPVDNVAVTLVNTATGLPAAVYGDDGISSFTATVTSGGTFTDSSGKVYAFPPGTYRFPFVTPGNYQLAVQPPGGYAAPSTVPTATLQTLPGAPFAIAEPGSRGEPFALNPGPALRIDIPVDPANSGLWIRKTANKDTAAVGDFVQYTLNVENSAGVAAPGVAVIDRLPLGFRYQKGSARQDGQVMNDPAVSADGRTLTFAGGDMADGASLQIRYVTEVGAGVKLGPAKNSARAASANSLTSNTAAVVVTVKEDLFRSDNFIVGRVIADNCSDAPTEADDGVPGVRLYLENGAYVITDKQGKYHFEGVSSGTHVVQLDLESLPEAYEISDCEKNTRAAGAPYSRFVDLQGGTLWRTDFHVNTKPAPRGEAGIKMSCGLHDQTVDFSAGIDVRTVDLSRVRLSVMLPEGVAYAAGTSRLGGLAIDDPDITGNVLTYRLGDAAAGATLDVNFQVRLNGAAGSGRLDTKAVLTFDTPSSRNQRTEAIDTILALTERKTREIQAPIVVRPLFETYSDRLLPDGRELLDGLVDRLSRFEIEYAVVVGHTDNLPIRVNSGGVFADNQALSLARAQRVADYLAGKLNLKPEQMTVSGKGDTQPLLSNETDTGRAYNRRVEVTVMAVKVNVVQDIATIKCEDQSIAATQGLQAAAPAAAQDPMDKPPAQDFERIDIETLTPGFGWLMPATGFNPPISSLKVAVQHGPDETVELQVNGRPVNPITFEGTRKNRARTLSVSYWRGIDLEEGDNLFTAVRKGRDGKEIERLQHTVHYAGFPVNAVLVKKASHLIANGKDAPIIAVRMTDKDGRPARPGVMGEYSVQPPYAAQTKVDEFNDGLPQINQQKPRYTVGPDGIARIRLQPTTQSGQAVALLYINGQEQEIRAWLQPEAREWILVGLAEGTAGYNTVSGNMEQLAAADQQEDYYTDGRLAFFAKGRIKGSWLLTAAYDSSRYRDDPDNRLFQTIDPDSYYTLYGDAAEQQYEAPSIRKLYLKIERGQFYALFGDYDTGLTVTELSRYSRRLNGLKSEYNGDRFGYSLFAADTNQAYVRDEIQGQGISGLYRLSRRDIIANSDTVTLQVRDRFHSEIVLSSQTLTRFVDYSIDFDAGTLFFKSPVYSRDENFNPIFIVAEYESNDPTDETLTYGGRGAVKLLGDRLEIGATAIHEGPTNAEGDLGGLDAQMQLGGGVKIKTEVSASRRDEADQEIRGEGYLAEVSKTTANLDAKLYYRELGQGFGLGQQNGSETGTRKTGADAAWRFTENWTMAGEAYRYDNLATDAIRNYGEAKVSFADTLYNLRAGARIVQDRYADGTVNDSDQLLLGLSRMFLDNRLQLRLNHDQSLGGNDDSVDFPTRTVVGADYKLAESVSVFGEHEITQGGSADAQSSRAGFKATPWTGGSIGSSLGQQTRQDGRRLFANLGLFQSWQINSRWSMDGGLDRSQTIRSENYAPFNADYPTAAGASEDFTAATLGLGYRADAWSWTGRAESRWAETQDKWGLVTGIAGEVRSGLGLSGGVKVFNTDSKTDQDTLDGDVRLSLAWRPRNTAWIVYDRLDYKFTRLQDSEGSTDARRIINNLNANFKPYYRLQLALQYGAKYVFDTIDDRSYSGYTDLTGIEARYDLSSRWDIGLQASLLHSWQSGQLDYRTGLSVGYTLVKNTWVSLGYNFTGFQDEDFSAADYTAQGPFIKFRIKFDQQTVKEMVDWFSR